MEAIYTDLHIHTSEDADNLNQEYDFDSLLNNLKSFSKVECSNMLISLTDHNVINKQAYKNIIDNSDINIVLGVELHIRNYDKCKPYHCHMFFDLPRNQICSNIDDINCILNDLYPKKMVGKTDNIPKLEEISKRFDKYDFLMLPHGGQSHSTFEKSFPRDMDISFDTAIERNIYYNQFDGFTSRSNTGVEETEKYFKRLGISSFVNLITCTDNYNPVTYPLSKSSKDESFVPTWINSKPTFQGLRLALSEKTRLYYQNNQPKFPFDYIKHVSLKNNYIDIDVDLTPGLNVVIGGSSSGKTLFLDSIYKKIVNDFGDYEKYAYKKYGVSDIYVDNPAGYVPHYINQNYIMKVIDEKSDDGIEKIDIIKNTFLSDDGLDRLAQQQLSQLKVTLFNVFTAADNIESLQKKIRNIPHFPRLIPNGELKQNYNSQWLPSSQLQELIEIDAADLIKIKDALDLVNKISVRNPFMKDLSSLSEEILLEFENANKKKKLSDKVVSVISRYKDEFDKKESESKSDELNKKINRENLCEYIMDYKTNHQTFYKSLDDLQAFSFKYKTEPIYSKGHKLTVESNFELSKETILESINEVLLSNYKISSFDEITPDRLFADKVDSRKRKNYKERIFSSIESKNKKNYSIVTKEGKMFDELSPGWKTAILLDLVLGYEKDIAPIFIDQPEDNLATSYINKELVEAVKDSKGKRQIVIISHNATIPMLADAQNIILCKNESGRIVIRSGAMEDSIENKKIIDSIAEITDGGKASVKKRVKKYNLKTFREE